jgi:hypothetical protein
MPSTPESQQEEGKAPPRRKPSTIVRIFRTLKRQYHHAKRYGKKEETEHQRNERIQARWTRNVGYFTIVLAFIAGVTAIILYLQLCTFRSTDQANKDAERAFVYMQSTGISPNTSPDQKRRWIFRASLQNTGTTSTREMSYAFDCLTNRAMLFDDRRLKERETVRYALGAKQIEGSQEACIVDDADMTNYIAAGTHLFVFGRATYRDIFSNSDPRHITEFCIDHFDFSRTKNRHLNDPYLIDARSTHCSEGHNCNDKECEASP